MEITRRSSPDGLELVLEGRLDAYWAEHLTSTLDEAIRDGTVQLSLDLAGVRYLSSGGIRAILIAHRELERVGGALRLGRLSEAVRSMLEMAGLLDKLALQPVEPTPVAEPRRSIDVAGCRLDVWEAPRPSSLTARRIGEPERLSSGYGREDCHEVVFPAPGFGLGLGALGSGFDDCRDRFGELVAIAGAQAHQPTDGTNKPDFLVTSSARTPAASLLYGLVCSGEPAVHARFRPSESPIELSALARAALELSAADAAALVVVAESAGLVGAALRRSPAGTEGAPDFSFPRVRRWLSFTAEKAWPGAQALIVGVAARAGAAPDLEPVLRPVAEADLLGHFHAAVFSYRPLPRGPLDLAATARGLFETEALRGILHLLDDDRSDDGIGETELRQGALWTGPLEVASA